MSGLWSSGLTFLLSVVSVLFVFHSEAAAIGSPLCQGVFVPVTLAPGETDTYQVYGWLCERTPRLKNIIHLFTSGATEGGPAYWDFPSPDFYQSNPLLYEPLRAQYFYINYLTDAGYASLTLDRIGTGKSDHPPAERVTIESNAFVIHQVIQALRRGELTKHAYETVIAVGRSLSAPILYMESAEFNDVDAIIIESFRRHQTPLFLEFATTFMPAQLEPRFTAVPLGYLTTRPGPRAAFFFQPPNSAEQRVIGHEEATKETVTDGEVATFFPSFSFSEQVTVPVLSVVGAYDILFCNEPSCPEANQEATFFPLAECFKSVLIPDVGHDMNLQLNGTLEVFPALLGWVGKNFGPGKVPCEEQ